MSRRDDDSIQEEPTVKSATRKQEITFLHGAAQRPPLAEPASWPSLLDCVRGHANRLQEEVHHREVTSEVLLKSFIWKKRVYNIKKQQKERKNLLYNYAKRNSNNQFCTLPLYRYDRIEIGWKDRQTDG